MSRRVRRGAAGGRPRPAGAATPARRRPRRLPDPRPLRVGGRARHRLDHHRPLRRHAAERRPRRDRQKCPTMGAVTSPTLSAGESSVYRCSNDGLAPVSSSYCVAVEGFVQHTVLARPAGDASTKYVGRAGHQEPGGEADAAVHHQPCLVRTACTAYPAGARRPGGLHVFDGGLLGTSEAGEYQITYQAFAAWALGAPRCSTTRPRLRRSHRAGSGSPSPTRAARPRRLDANVKQVNHYTPADRGTGRVRVRAAGRDGQARHGADPGCRVRRRQRCAPGGALVGATRDLPLHPRRRLGHGRPLTFSPNLQLAPGDYWIGPVGGRDTDISRLSHDPPTPACGASTPTCSHGGAVGASARRAAATS